MDSVIVYTAAVDRLWREFRAAAEASGAIVHGAPPQVAIELDDARIYVTERAGAEATAPTGRALSGPGAHEFVIDIHNAVRAEQFLADVLAHVDAVVDDDHGGMMSNREFLERVRARPGD